MTAVRLWGKKLSGEGPPVETRSDSSVALAMARKLASASPANNFLGAALALALEQHHIGGVQAVHVPGALNKTADWLSRLAMPGGGRRGNSLLSSPGPKRGKLRSGTSPSTASPRRGHVHGYGAVALAAPQPCRPGRRDPGEGDGRAPFTSLALC